MDMEDSNNTIESENPTMNNWRTQLEDLVSSVKRNKDISQNSTFMIFLNVPNKE